MTSSLPGRFPLLVLLGLVPVRSSGLAPARPPTLRQMSIEDLMNIEVTLASRKEERASDVAAAVFVITHDDIRRSGMTTIPDVLRLTHAGRSASVQLRWTFRS
jgi:iron complex outermembrane recepter protein